MSALPIGNSFNYNVISWVSQSKAEAEIFSGEDKVEKIEVSYFGESGRAKIEEKFYVYCMKIFAYVQILKLTEMDFNLF